MADIFLANFDGTGSLAGYTPDVGAAITLVAKNTDDSGFWFAPYGPTTLTLADYLRDGAGAVALPVTGSGYNIYTHCHRPGTQPSTTDYFAELSIRGDIGISTIYVKIAVRCIDMTGAPSEWADGIYNIGTEIDAGGNFGEISVYDNSVDPVFLTTSNSQVYVDPTDYSGTVQDFTFRVEIEGTTRRIKVNGVEVYSDTWPSGYTAPGEVFFFFNWGYNNTPPVISKMRVGTLPEVGTGFWTERVKTTEVDS